MSSLRLTSTRNPIFIPALRAGAKMGNLNKTRRSSSLLMRGRLKALADNRLGPGQLVDIGVGHSKPKEDKCCSTPGIGVSELYLPPHPYLMQLERVATRNEANAYKMHKEWSLGESIGTRQGGTIFKFGLGEVS